MSEEIMLGYKKSLLNYCDRQTYVKMVVCGILGYDENNMYHQRIGDFYDNYLKKYHLKTAIREFFISNDVAKALLEMSDEEKNILATNLMGYIVPIVACINNAEVNENAYEDAVYLFISMNNFLRKTVNCKSVFVIEGQLGEQEDSLEGNMLRKVM